MKRIAEIARQGITCIKNAENPYFNSKYADLGTVVQALKKPLEDAGLGYLFRIETGVPEGWSVVIEIFDLADSVCLMSSRFPITLTDPQKMGSAITYAKRYLLTTTFNVIAEEDDDGNAAEGNKPTLPKKKPVPLSAKDLCKEVNDEIPTFFK